MVLHAGNNRILRTGDVIGIFDLDTSTRGEDTKAFLRRAEREGIAETAGDELPKSFILYEERTTRGKRRRVLFSQISAAALKSRAEDALKTLSDGV